MTLSKLRQQRTANIGFGKSGADRITMNMNCIKIQEKSQILFCCCPIMVKIFVIFDHCKSYPN